MSSIQKIIDKTVAPIETDLDGWEKAAGNPTMKTWIEYTSPDESMITGCWEATPGTYRTHYAAWEFVHMISGEVIITPDGGEAQTYSAGDAFMVEADFVGTWEITETVFKHFAIKLK